VGPSTLDPQCVDRDAARCAGWARGGECAKNPGFMLGEATPGSCLKSCCDGDVEMPREMTIWQREFCASCEAGRTKAAAHEEI
jgi:prolyl 4-hydroxylase